MSSEEPQQAEAGRRVPWIGLVLLAALGAGGITLVLRAPRDRFVPHVEVDADEGPEVSASASASAVVAPRCERTAPSRSHRIAATATPRPASPPPATSAEASTGAALGAAELDEPEELNEPFAAETGRAVALADGFAVGVRADGPSGAEASVVVFGADGTLRNALSLGRSRGDVPPPVVAAKNAGKASGWLAATLEPDAAAYSLRVLDDARAVDAGGRALELEQGRDESQAFDLASGPAVAIATWDDVTRDDKLGRAVYAVLAADGSKLIGKPRTLSGKGVDAEVPRVVPREGGFVVAYIARNSRAKTNAKGKDDGDDGRYAAERIEPSFVEVALLDEQGEVTSPPRAVTPPTGYVLAFDLAAGNDGSVRIVWRDDDTPSGAGGGKVELAIVSPSGAASSQLVAKDDVGAGVPALLPGWLAVTDSRGRALLGPLADDGSLAAALLHEPAVGAGQPIAARGDTLLVATPIGTAIELVTVRCRR